MNKKHKYIGVDVGEIINLTLFLTAENENRYIIDTRDIERFLETFETNLKNQNIIIRIDGERLDRNTYYSDKIQKISYAYENDDYNQYSKYFKNSPYFILKPWYDLNDLCKSFAGGMPYSFIRACYTDSLFQNLPPRSEEDLKTMNQIYQKYLEEKEEENKRQYEFYDKRIKTLIKRKQQSR